MFSLSIQIKMNQSFSFLPLLTSFPFTNYQESSTIEEFQSFFIIYLLKDRICFLPETMLLPRPIQNSIRAILDTKYYVRLICYSVPMENSNLKYEVKVPPVKEMRNLWFLLYLMDRSVEIQPNIQPHIQ